MKIPCCIAVALLSIIKAEAQMELYGSAKGSHQKSLVFLQGDSITGWWFERFFWCSPPKIGEMIHFDYIIFFSRGWNHQLVDGFTLILDMFDR